MSARWLAVGSALFGMGGLLAVGWLIFVRQEHETYWSWPGVAGLVLIGVGLVGLVAGLLVPDRDDGPHQEQHGGSHSVNLQAGRDITIHDDKRTDQR